MNIRDKTSVKDLYYIHRFIPTTIARLFGVSHVTIHNILQKDKHTMIVSDTECLLCGLEDALTYYIDGNKNNNDSQNLIMLCDADRRRIRALQLRRKNGFIQPQSESSPLEV